jgi:hypothetical protein
VKNLPESLDETYERIFASIPGEHRLFVQQVLMLICGVSDLRSMPVTTKLLLELTICALNNRVPVSPEQHFYSRSDLLDICGCLVTLSPEPDISHDDEYAQLAHYTVKEFLYSGRIRSEPASFFALSDFTVRVSIGKMILEGLLALPGDGVDTDYDEEDNVPHFCLGTSGNVLYSWGAEAAQDAEFSRLFWSVMDPLRPHWNTLKDYIASGRDVGSTHFYFTVDWRSSPEDPDVTVLAHLLAHEGLRERGGWADPIAADFGVAMRFLENRNLESLIFEPCIDAELDEIAPRQQPISLMDFCYEWVGTESKEPFEFLRRIVAERIGPTASLLAYLGGHSCSVSCGGSCECALQLFLGPDVDLDAVDFTLTPLQIAACRLDVCGVECLLQAGAPVNGTGNLFGRRPYIPRRFPEFYLDLWADATPLKLARQLNTWISDPEQLVSSEERASGRREVEELLVQHGGIESFGSLNYSHQSLEPYLAYDSMAASVAHARHDEGQITENGLE